MLRRYLLLLSLLVLSLLGFSACSAIGIGRLPTLPASLPGVGVPGVATSPSLSASPTAGLSSIPTVTSVALGSPTAPAAQASPTVAAAPETATVVANPSSPAADAIKSVILKGNQEEVQAVASHNPSVMRDTSTTGYYQQMVQTLNEMLSSGVTAIELVNLQWGAITMQGSSSAQATTVETWRTTFADGGTLQESDTNVYTLVLQNDGWKVQDDQHPNSRTLQPPSGSAGPVPTPGTPVAPVAPSGPGRDTSRNWSGYAATGGTFTAVSGTWQVPNVSAGRSAADATWVGIGGVSSRDLIQAGTQASVQGGQVSYSAWWETLPQAAVNVPLDVNAGDTISVSITQQPDGTWQVLIRDQTSNQSFQKNLKYSSSRSSAEWIEESPAAGRRMLLPLDNFGAVTFTNASTVENGKTRNITQAGGQPITMEVTPGQPLAQPSALTASGDSFTVTRTDVTAPGVLPGGRNRP